MNRRSCETREIEYVDHRFVVTVGFDPTGRPLEVFADVRTSEMGHVIADACVVISLALQHGCPVEALTSALGRVPDPARGPKAMAPASPLGAILDAVEHAGQRGVAA